ncbi:phospholipase D family protein [Burkholderia cenocepacia]|uniref:phospholipase D family nuclease n=1 Tax=Burkholderia cenocepacia TaxID=95486 RepID=UPI002AB5F11B|nr:phospholipase D family protein [Burkholderia cenocepacia]
MALSTFLSCRRVAVVVASSASVTVGLLATPAGAFADTTSIRPAVQVGFSPEGGAVRLVLDVIERADREIRVMAYSFTSPEIARALVAAKRRGVDVQLVVDAGESRNSAATAALNLLTNAGVPVRLNDRYKIQHDKVIVADGKHVETGSFNFSRAAARSNSENVVVIWNRPEVAAAYLEHWRSRWNGASPFRSTY